MKKSIVSVVFAALMLTGCSSIISKSEYSVAINSAPTGASFVISNENGQEVHSGVTPETVVLKSSSGYFAGASYNIAFTAEGYGTKNYTLNSSLDGWYLGNVVFGGLLGMLIVDPATGAMYNLPERVDVSQQVGSTADATLTIASINTLTDEQRSKLIKL